ncbi:separase isoform X2 [Syzygium oleosum]|uniref:separase isoform X2 n=1 Tax=Syzygium oleosum TaxID=219896 RepID=UPI0024B9ACFC|nr:separase isoform X2 [Syzygium oleosum]
MASDAVQSALLSKLEASLASHSSDDIHSLFSDHLRPFSDLAATAAAAAKPKKSSKSAGAGAGNNQQGSIRSLAKQYLSFLNRSLSLLPKLLSAPRPDQSRLFETYGLCLDCLGALSSQLACKPYSVHVQRSRYVHCFESCGLYGDAASEGFRLLESLRGIDFGDGGGRARGKGGLLPPAGKPASEDREFAVLVVEMVVTTVKCVAMGQSKDARDYSKLLGLVDEVRPWFGVLDANTYDKLQRALVTYLGKCTVFMVGELSSFDGDFVRSFCTATLIEYGKSSMKGEIFKFARRICSILISLSDERTSLIFDVLTCLLESSGRDGKIEKGDAGAEIMALFSYCANRCRDVTTSFCCKFSVYIKDIATKKVSMPVSLILKLYALGLYILDGKVKPKDGGSRTSKVEEDGSTMSTISGNGDRLNSLPSLFSLLRSYFLIESKRNYSSSNDLSEDSSSHTCSRMDLDFGTSISFQERGDETYFMSYLSALKFLCQLLAELINSERKHIIAGSDVDSASLQFCAIQDACNHFLDVFVFFKSSKYGKDRDRYEEHSKAVPAILVAAFTLCFVTKLNLQENMHLIDYVIASEWVQPQWLKFLFASLYNLSIILYRNKQVEEASKALKLSCRASWTYIMHNCRSLGQNPSELVGLTRDAVNDINEACARSAFYLDVLHQCGGNKVNRECTGALKNWSVAMDLVRGLPGPLPLVKQWVKIQCKQHRHADAGDSLPILYQLLSSCVEIPKATLAIISEQELLAYEEINSSNPELCSRMQMKIIDVLLQEIYFAKASCFQKAKLLIKKGRILKCRGREGLNSCIQCLSEAISTIDCVSKSSSCSAVSERYLLASAYSLRALCTQEAEPKSKGILEDINAALNLWLSIKNSDSCSLDEDDSVLAEISLPLLYNIIDILSLKGCSSFSHKVFKLIIGYFNSKNLAPQKYLTLLWESRRMSHALCFSPISEAFITVVSEHHGEIFKSMDHWMCCLKESPPLLVGFQNILSLLLPPYCKESSREFSLEPYIGGDRVKEAAVGLISSVPLSTRAVYLAGFLCYDLSERMILSGRLHEALLFAKESHELRTRLFQEKFTHSVEQTQKHGESGEFAQKYNYSIRNLHVSKTEAAEVWSFDSNSFDVESCYLSPWNIMQGYLESTLQVGTILERIGNGTDAETFLLWGKNISCLQDLPQFDVAFSSVLGKIYRRKRCWDMATKELETARQLLMDCGTTFSCSKCRLLLEATVDLQFGDLVRAQSDDSSSVSADKLSHAEELYQSALDRLSLLGLRIPVKSLRQGNSNSLMVQRPIDKSDDSVATNASLNSSSNQQNGRCVSMKEKLTGKVENKKGRKTKTLPKSTVEEQPVTYDGNKRLTRSRYRCLSQGTSLPSDVQVHPTTFSEGSHLSGCNDNSDKTEWRSHCESLTHDSGTKALCICSKWKCWNCLHVENIKSGSVNSFIHMRLEFFSRRLSSRLFTGIGKCRGTHDQIHKTHAILLQSISNVVRGDLSSQCSVPVPLLLDLVGKETEGDGLRIERAAVLYNISWFSLKSYHTQNTRVICCELSHIQLPQIASWLKLAFVLCHEVPTLMQKVSKLLALTYILSATSETYLSSDALSENHWASFFHQASLGAHVNHLFTYNAFQKCKARTMLDAEGQGLIAAGTTSIMEAIGKKDLCKYLRLAPESIQNLEDLVRRFFGCLPCATVLCISVVDGSDAKLLQELLLCPSHIHAWMIFTRLNRGSQPIVVLMPLDPILEDDFDAVSNSEDESSSSNKSLDKHWHCPWGSSVVDNVVPTFKEILEENYLSCSLHALEDTKENRLLWWTKRKNLDLRLGKLLGKLEESWLGPWRCLLLGGSLNCTRMDTVLKKLVCDLKRKCKINIDAGLLKVILGGVKLGSKREALIPLLQSNRTCYIGSINQYVEERDRIPSFACEGAGELSELAFQLIHEAIKELEEEDHMYGEPIILVLDSEVQMLPWENLPALRNQEVYRMPSVGSIFLTLDRSSQREEQQVGPIASFPFIDPLDAYYLLNPSGDLSSTQVEFENWFRDQKLKGNAGFAPVPKELALALTSHDLFIYFGHGSGSQYIPRHEIQKLDTCAATLLMGCSSGSLLLNGAYVPEGTSLSYLLAGSPVIIANLWEVTDKDIDRFGKAMLDAWLKERSNSTGCAPCSSLANEFKAIDLKNNGGNPRKKLSKKKSPELSNTKICTDTCRHKPMIGSFMGQAREACTLPFLIGASPVCYGVPTGIKRKMDL